MTAGTILRHVCSCEARLDPSVISAGLAFLPGSTIRLHKLIGVSHFHVTDLKPAEQLGSPPVVITQRRDSPFPFTQPVTRFCPVPEHLHVR